jgi:hypothetical protein
MGHKEKKDLKRKLHADYHKLIKTRSILSASAFLDLSLAST